MIGGAGAPPEASLNWFTAKLAFETDPADVAATIEAGEPLRLIDARSPEAYAGGHVPGAISLPHSQIEQRSVASLDPDVPIVVYCWGPHCNGADKAAQALARCGRAARVMIGGIWGWEQEGFRLHPSDGDLTDPPGSPTQ